MNIPDSNQRNAEIPAEAEGNPVYEQTRQDMPLWCCGRNCGRNTRFVVLCAALIGIGCSVWALLSVNYFTFVQLRNDTFYDEAKYQPQPFRYATEAHVGLMKYEILDVFVYPWPERRERALFDEMLLQELDRMQEQVELEQKQEASGHRQVEEANSTTSAPSAATDVNATEAPSIVPGVESNITVSPTEPGVPTYEPTAAPTKVPTPAPTLTLTPTAPATAKNCSVVEPGVGSVGCVSLSPTENPSAAPTRTDPNIIVEEEVDLNTVKKYKDGEDTLDSAFKNAQRGALLGPIFAFVGTLFGLVELCCCTYKCSWLPTALFLYLAFMFQLMTLFLFLSEDWCKYDQECALGNAGFASVIAIMCYFFAQNLVCCSPRPTPLFKCCKKPPVRKKKKKKNEDDEDEDDNLMRDYDDPDGNDNFNDEPSSRGSYYDDDEDNGDYDYADDDGDYGDNTLGDSDVYDDSTYGQDTGTYGDDDYYTQDGDDTYYTNDDGYDSQYDQQHSNVRY
eukprot:Nitzschia sp. Nitz4//scaffold32_size149145//62395//64083//NITZ4_002879-RA/size149145-augustus-gene-0.37-mRNA-1//1//CDS//3329548069//4460//frame0